MDICGDSCCSADIIHIWVAPFVHSFIALTSCLFYPLCLFLVALLLLALFRCVWFSWWCYLVFCVRCLLLVFSFLFLDFCGCSSLLLDSVTWFVVLLLHVCCYLQVMLVSVMYVCCELVCDVLLFPSFFCLLIVVLFLLLDCPLTTIFHNFLSCIIYMFFLFSFVSLSFVSVLGRLSLSLSHGPSFIFLIIIVIPAYPCHPHPQLQTRLPAYRNCQHHPTPLGFRAEGCGLAIRRSLNFDLDNLRPAVRTLSLHAATHRSYALDPLSHRILLLRLTHHQKLIAELCDSDSQSSSPLNGDASPSMISASSRIRIPMDLRKAWWGNCGSTCFNSCAIARFCAPRLETKTGPALWETEGFER